MFAPNLVARRASAFSSASVCEWRVVVAEATRVVEYPSAESQHHILKHIQQYTRKAQVCTSSSCSSVERNDDERRCGRARECYVRERYSVYVITVMTDYLIAPKTPRSVTAQRAQAQHPRPSRTGEALALWHRAALSRRRGGPQSSGLSGVGGRAVDLCVCVCV